MSQKVEVGCTVTFEVYKGRVTADKGGASGKHLIYERYEQIPGRLYLEKKLITDGKVIKKGELHFDSFVGRATMGQSVGYAAEVNVMGLNFRELPVGRSSGNHLMYKIVSIEAG